MNKKTLWAVIIIIILWLLSLFLVYKFALNKFNKTNDLLNNNTNIEYVDSNKTYNKFYNETTFNDLKNTNKTLYDSLKQYKNQIDYLTQFTYTKTYSTGKIITSNKQNNGIINNNITLNKKDTTTTIYSIKPKDYIYTSEPNDTFTYKLTINAEKEPNYYLLDAKVKEKFTLVNKTDDNGNNHITIQGNNKGDITDVTTYKKKQTTPFLKRFAVGPAVTVGYDPFNNRVTAVCGVSLTFNLLK